MAIGRGMHKNVIHPSLKLEKWPKETPEYLIETVEILIIVKD